MGISKIKMFVAFFVGAIMFTTIGAYAANLYNASQIAYKDTTVDKALDELYNNSEKKSGELFLQLAKSNEFSIYHNYPKSNTAKLILSSLDFSNIKSFTYSWTIDTNNNDNEYQYVVFLNRNNDEEIMKSSKTETATVDINGLNNIEVNMLTSQSGINKFKVISYTTMDGIVHN